VIVNGVRYDTSRATFKIDGRVGTQNELEVGDVVTVTGALGSGGLTGTAGHGDLRRQTSTARSRRSTPRPARSSCSARP